MKVGKRPSDNGPKEPTLRKSLKFFDEEPSIVERTSMETEFDSFFNGFTIGGIFALLIAISCSGCIDFPEYKIQESTIAPCGPEKPTCIKDPCDLDPQLACPDPGEGKDLYIRDYETCTCSCTKKWIQP